MQKITVPMLLNGYKTCVETGQIQFIKHTEQKNEIIEILNSLIEDFAKAEKAAGKIGNLSEQLDWHETNKKGKELWQLLVSFALNNIEPDSKGNSKLFEFLDTATEFEDLLYGLDRHYRDHTLHCLWVYFLGEQILRGSLSEIHKNLNWYLFNDIEGDGSSYEQTLLNRSIEKEKDICQKVNEKRDAIWCLMALCHDLGYSIAKLDKLNEKVKAVLTYFDLSRYQQVGYSLDVEHEYHVSQFLELMAMEVRIVPNDDLKEVLIKGYRDDSTYWRLCRALEKKQHGILSAYLIYKTLGIFANSCIRESAEEWGLDEDEAVDNIVMGDILFAITQHEFDFAHLNELSSLADILVIADELEEFSRYGRQILSRKYYDTTADVAISFKPKRIKQGQDIEIEIMYEVAKHLQDKPEEFHRFYKRKADQMCKMYSLIAEKKKVSKFCTIKSIKMTVVNENLSLVFELHRGTDSTIFAADLPASKVDSKSYTKGRYDLTCDDDKLLVRVANKRISLEKWLENVDK